MNIRVDDLLIEKGIAKDKKNALAMVMAGDIFIDNIKVDTVGEKIKSNSNIIYKGKNKTFVSRGGFKLEKALKEFNVDLKNKNIIDIGSSTGGFTDCCLKHNAKQVIALDVGTNQLDYSLRSNDKVAVFEKTNIKDLSNITLPFNPEIAVSDVSFISLRHVFEAIEKVSINTLIGLIKPQFEVNKEIADQYHGIVNNKDIHIDVITNLLLISSKYGYNMLNLSYSPVTGGRNGNIEYIALFDKEGQELKKDSINEVVEKAFKELL